MVRFSARKTDAFFLYFFIGAVPMCFHLNILSVISVKTQLIYCQL